MRVATLRRRRAWAFQAILGVLSLLAFVIGGVAAGLTSYLGAATEAGVQTTLADVAPSEFALEIAADSPPDVAAADEAIREQLEDLAADVSFELHRSEVSSRRTIFADEEGPPEDADPDAGLARAIAISYEGITDHADLVAGEWPGKGDGGTVPTAVHAAAAADLGVDVGDVLSFASRGEVLPFEITALWEPADPEDPFWFGEQAELTGANQAIGLVAVMDRANLERIPGANITSRWRLVPVIDELSAADISTLRTGLPRLGLRLESDTRLAGTRVFVDDQLVGVFRDSDDRIQAARSVAVVPLILLGLASVIALAMVAGLLASLRGPETALLRARGGSAGQITRWSVPETLLVIVVPMFIGAAVAWSALHVVPDIGERLSIVSALAGVGAAVVIGVVTVLIVTVRSAARAVESTVEERAASTRRQTLMRVGTVGLVLVTAILTVWQLRRYGAPTVTDAAGVARIDPLAVSAPTAALVAGGVAAALLVSVLAWILQRLVVWRRGLATSLAVRNVARAPAAYALPVVLVALAAGGGTFTAGFAGSWSDLQSTAASARTGADFSVNYGAAGASVTPSSGDVDVRSFTEIDGVERVTPAVVASRATTADGSVELIALGGEAATVPPAGVVLPVGSDTVEVEFSVDVDISLDEEYRDALAAGVLQAWSDAEFDEPITGQIRPQLWLTNTSGVAATVLMERIEVGEDDGPLARRMQADLPDSGEEWTLIGVELAINGPQRWDRGFWMFDLDIEVTAVTAAPSGTEVAITDAPWTLTTMGTLPRNEPEFLTASDDGGLGVRIDSGGNGWYGTVRVRLSQDGRDEEDALPVKATSSALAGLGLSVGDRANLRVFGTELPVVIDERVEAVAGTTASQVMVTDLSDLTAFLVATGQRVPLVTQLRIDVDDSASGDGSAAAAVHDAAGPDSIVLDRLAIEAELRGNAFAGLSLITFWATAGAVGLLAIAGVAAGTAVLANRRRGEVPVLRSLGFTAGQQGRARTRELGLVAVLAVLLGSGVGWFVAVLTAGLLSDAATPSTVATLEPVIRIAWVPWLGFTGGLIVLALMVARVYGRRVRNQASAVSTVGRWS